MCGICGIFETSLQPQRNISAIREMSAALAHRGPDSHGLFETPYLALAIRRLSIIDLKTGDQPLSNETGGVKVVFNGEIYNYRELRRGLASRGHQFKTQSDGEVIAHLYEERREEFVKELDGMFAIALWDSERKRLMLARDRAGEKPLYYWEGQGTLVFASEIKALLRYPGVSRRLDPEAARQYMFYGYVPSPRSIFAEIRKLPAGCRMMVDSGCSRIEPFWRLRDYLPRVGEGRASKPEERQIVHELRVRLRESVASRLVSDVPLGVFLSGGLDSSTLVALTSELAPGQVNAFSVAFDEKSFDEEPYAALVARRFGARRHVLRVDAPALLEGLQKLAETLDEPLADPAVVPTYLLSCFARQSIKVALSGEGSDELFGGYPTYLGEKLAPYYLRLPRPVRRVIRRRLAPILPVTSGAVPVGLFLQSFLRDVENGVAERHQSWFGIVPPEAVEDLFGGRNDPKLRDTIAQPFRDAIAGVDFENGVAEALYLDFVLYLQDDLLVKTDRASMACSLELRAPFLDHRLIEFAAGLPVNLKLRRFELKSLLKKAVNPWLPRQIVNRQKRGFSVPIARWLRAELRPLVDEMLSEQRLKSEGIFDSEYVRGMVRRHQSGKEDCRKPLWALLCFELWREHWMRE